MRKYKFWFETYLPEEKYPTLETVQDLFQTVADKVQEVIPFDNDDWDFSYKGDYEEDEQNYENI